MQGWVKLHRQIMESRTFSTLNAKQQIIAIYLILNANHKDGFWYDVYNGTEVEVKRGQLITSRKKIAHEWFKKDKDISEQVVRTTLDKLEKLNFLTKESTNRYTLITIDKYSNYQSEDNQDNQQNNQGLTKGQPRVNQGLTTNKNVKNEKNVREELGDNNNPHTFYEQNFGILKPFVAENISDWCTEMSDELVVASMKLAIKNNKSHFGYCEAILKDWESKGVRTIEDARSLPRNTQQTSHSNVTPIRKPERQYNYGF
ncbi:DnaD domain protein [Halobacillus sp. Cin3]|uniref:DnaD domain-containing protein n=1 Tax=Halobacillus sp. Cin3 TaxID=2928441 RepID=UPI00248E6F9E|nr:DnaD domain protein [Halobacillus sp. Cin3]